MFSKFNSENFNDMQYEFIKNLPDEVSCWYVRNSCVTASNAQHRELRDHMGPYATWTRALGGMCRQVVSISLLKILRISVFKSLFG